MTTSASISRSIQNFPDALAASDNLAAFVAATGQTYLLSIEWASHIFDTLKFNRHCDASWKYLYFPQARKFSDLFEVARFQVTGKAPDGFHFVSGNNAKGAVYSGHMGGKRYVKEFKDGTVCRGHGGNVQYFGTYVKPRPEVVAKVEPGLIDRVGSFEVVTQSSGAVLVTVRDALGIGERWLAVFDPETTIDEIMVPEDLAALKAELAAQADDWSCIVKGDDGREYLNRETCKIEIRHG